MSRMVSKYKRKFSELQNYSKSHSSNGSIFTQAEEYPSFFNENLVDQDRTIKLFMNQSHCHETIFYFQLLKLIFEVEEVDYQKYLIKIYELIDDPDFQLVLPDEASRYYVHLSDMKIKRILQEFLDELGEGTYDVSEMLRKYAVMDKVFIIFIRTILVLGDKCDSFDEVMDPSELYEFLAEFFEVEVTYYNNCLRFNHTDVFVYFQSEQEVYLAYLSPKVSEQEMPPPSESYYQTEPEQAFNLSSVHQMISEIDIEEKEEECFNISKQDNEGNETEIFVDYDYSNSHVERRPSKSMQENSELKFSYLVNEESVLNSCSALSNKVLEKDGHIQKKSNFRPPKLKQEFFQIPEVPLEYENALSPLQTPKGTLFIDRPQAHNKQNKVCRFNQIDAVNDQMVETNESETIFRKKEMKDNDVLKTLQQQTDMLFGNNCSEVSKPKTQKNLNSLYELRSIKTIVSDNNESFFEPSARSSFNPSFQPSFQLSRKPTNQGQGQIPHNPFAKTNQYTKHGYVNNNISNEFTSSLFLKKMKEPFKGNIENLKVRARKERSCIQNMII